MKKVGFDDVLRAISLPEQYLIINTLTLSEQNCLIYGTLSADREEEIINEMLNSYSSPQKHIIVYGKNNCDESAEKKYKQLISLGISDVYVYVGGLFEWLLLQEVFGDNLFKTTSRVLDILKYQVAKPA